MKKLINYALFGAIVLSGTFGLTACSSSDDVAINENPTYDPATNSVTTQFVLNIASPNMSPMTRQGAATVQQNKNFRGMQDARIFALKTTHPTWLAPYTGSETLKKTYDLGTLYTPSMVDNTGDNNKDASSNRVLELSLPLETDAMLVYSKAIVNGTDAQNGKNTTNLATVTDSKDITFDLVARIGEKTTEYQHTKNLAALILNRILMAQIDAQTTPYERSGISYGDLPSLKWSDVAADASANGLAEILKNAYITFTTIKPGEMRAGSASAIKSQVYYLNKTIQSVLSAIATSKNELNAQRLAENISTRITSYFNELDAVNTTEFNSLGEWNASESKFSDGSILSHLTASNVNAITPDDYNLSTGAYYGVTGEGLKKFPAIFNIPEGSAQLKFDATDLFSYDTNATSLLDKTTTDNPAKYMYPAELWYFDNSALRVNDADKKQADYPNGYNNWDTNDWTGWTTGASAKVSSTTRAVAVKNNINYGVAMLQSKVTLGSSSTYADNRHELVSTEVNQELTEAQVKEMQLTGILIGGQFNQMGWNYLAKSGSANAWDHMIYDTDIPNSGKIPTASGSEIYTLVFDNYRDGTLADQQDVYVALEFKNGTKEFYGNKNMIPAGGTFYLVGKLPIKKNDTEYNTISSWDTYYAIPPYTDSGDSKEITRIFTQDYMTTANFVIGANSLQSAFVTVPDLRSSQTSLGLSVDLNWRAGLSFDNVVLGGN
jgi:hypothetical protein